jgi:hypothetical protein
MSRYDDLCRMREAKFAATKAVTKNTLPATKNVTMKTRRDLILCRKASRLARARRASDLLFAAAILTMPAHRHPVRMVIDPLRDVRLRGHGALIERHLRRELQMLILAMIGSRQSAYRQYDLDEAHWPVSIRNQSRRRGTNPAPKLGRNPGQSSVPPTTLSCELKTCTLATCSAWASGHFSAQTARRDSSARCRGDAYG